MITEKCSGFPYMRQAGREWVAVCLSVCLWNFNRRDCCIRKERVLVIQVTLLLPARLCRIERTARNWCTGSKVHLRSLNTTVFLCIASAVCFGNILLSFRRALPSVMSSNALVCAQLVILRKLRRITAKNLAWYVTVLCSGCLERKAGFSPKYWYITATIHDFTSQKQIILKHIARFENVETEVS